MIHCDERHIINTTWHEFIPLSFYSVAHLGSLQLARGKTLREPLFSFLKVDNAPDSIQVL